MEGVDAAEMNELFNKTLPEDVIDQYHNRYVETSFTNGDYNSNLASKLSIDEFINRARSRITKQEDTELLQKK